MAIVVVSPDAGVQEIAVEGERAPGGGRFGPLGAVSALPAATGARIAFTDASAAGRFLYVYENRRLRRVFAYNTRTGGPTPTWLSSGRPAIAADGSIALRAAERAHEYLLRISHDGHVSEIAGVRDRIPGFGRFDGLTDPMFASGGVLFFAASNIAGEQAIFSTSSGGSAPPRLIDRGVVGGAEFEVGLPPYHAVSGTTMSVTASGAVSYLGGR